MTFVEYLVYVDIPVSLAIFVVIMTVLDIKGVKIVRRKRKEDDFDDDFEDDFEDDFDESMPDPSAFKELPKWLLKASYKQLYNYAKHNQYHHWLTTGWKPMMIFKLNKKIENALKVMTDEEDRNILKNFFHTIYINI